MPNILLEKMAAVLPIVCSRRGTMPEILVNSGEYFDPEQPEEISHALETLLNDSDLRCRHAHGAADLASRFTWELYAEETFSFLSRVANRPR